jgi:alanine-synthesizing transaminase
MFNGGETEMFSNRFKWNLETNQLARLIEAKRGANVPLLDLTEANPTRARLIYPQTEILNALAQPGAMLYEPAPCGLSRAREAVAAYYAERGLAVDPTHVCLTASTSEAYAYLFKLLCDQGDNVLVPQPSYPLFDFLAALEGVELRPYTLEYQHPREWAIDFDSLQNALTPQTRAIMLVNPNNPTGSFIKAHELAELNRLCQQHGLALIVDEVFGDYGLPANVRQTVSLVENEAALTFVLSGFSKILALPQMKLGWIVTNGPVALRAEAEERLELIADTFLSVGAPVQHAAAQWLTLRADLQQQITARTAANLAWLAALVEGSPCRLLTVEGGWYATLEVPRHVSEEELILRLLAEDDVLVHPGYFFDFPREAFLVLSLLTSSEIFRPATQRLFLRAVNG